jgi:hypothetical protein
MLRENVIVENDCLEQGVWCGYVLPKLAGGLGEYGQIKIIICFKARSSYM